VQLTAPCNQVCRELYDENVMTDLAEAATLVMVMMIEEVGLTSPPRLATISAPTPATALPESAPEISTIAQWHSVDARGDMDTGSKAV
jgi:hypothetical protein